jgi:AcrR family transcriptional regulator
MATQDTKVRILDVAEQLFGSRGFQGTSLRAVTSDADVNLAAVHYHFGSKEALLRATMERRVGPANRERLRRLSKLEAEAGGAAVPLEQILEAFLRPMLEIGKGSPEERGRLRQLAGRIYGEPPEIIRPLLLELFGEVLHRFLAALSRALPQLRPEEVALRFHFGTGVLIHSISEHHSVVLSAEAALTPVDDETMLSEMISFLSAGLRAPSSHPKGRKIGKRAQP